MALLTCSSNTPWSKKSGFSLDVDFEIDQGAFNTGPGTAVLSPKNTSNYEFHTRAKGSVNTWKFKVSSYAASQVFPANLKADPDFLKDWEIGFNQTAFSLDYKATYSGKGTASIALPKAMCDNSDFGLPPWYRDTVNLDTNDALKPVEDFPHWIIPDLHPQDKSQSLAAVNLTGSFGIWLLLHEIAADKFYNLCWLKIDFDLKFSRSGPPAVPNWNPSGKLTLTKGCGAGSGTAVMSGQSASDYLSKTKATFKK